MLEEHVLQIIRTLIPSNIQLPLKQKININNNIYNHLDVDDCQIYYTKFLLTKV